MIDSWKMIRTKQMEIVYKSYTYIPLIIYCGDPTLMNSKGL
jgi:hypothetical protein